jgi:hypothetical protein
MTKTSEKIPCDRAPTVREFQKNTSDTQAAIEFDRNETLKTPDSVEETT